LKLIDVQIKRHLLVFRDGCPPESRQHHLLTMNVPNTPAMPSPSCPVDRLATKFAAIDNVEMKPRRWQNTLRMFLQKRRELFSTAPTLRRYSWGTRPARKPPGGSRNRETTLSRKVSSIQCRTSSSAPFFA
jgi:hypothetical protein